MTEDYDGIAYHARIEKLKMLITQTIVDGEMNIEEFEEQDIVDIMLYLDKIFAQVAQAEDVPTKTGILTRAVIVNVAQTIWLTRQLTGKEDD